MSVPPADIENDARVQLLLSQLAKELAQADKHAKWYQDRAARDKSRFYRLRITAIVTAALISLMASLQLAVEGVTYINVSILVFSLFATALSSFETLLGYEKSQVDHKRAELNFYALMRNYKRERQHILVAASIEQAIEIANRILDNFRSDYEEIVRDSVERFEERAHDGALLRVPTTHQ